MDQRINVGKRNGYYPDCDVQGGPRPGDRYSPTEHLSLKGPNNF